MLVEDDWNKHMKKNKHVRNMRKSMEYHIISGNSRVMLPLIASDLLEASGDVIASELLDDTIRYGDDLV